VVYLARGGWTNNQYEATPSNTFPLSYFTHTHTHTHTHTSARTDTLTAAALVRIRFQTVSFSFQTRDEARQATNAVSLEAKRKALETFAPFKATDVPLAVLEPRYHLMAVLDDRRKMVRLPPLPKRGRVELRCDSWWYPQSTAGPGLGTPADPNNPRSDGGVMARVVCRAIELD
jgi:hypothetical protein